MILLLPKKTSYVSLDVNDIIAAEKDLLCDKDAERIVEFSEKYKDKLLIIHCDAGISRSSGIAAAILRHYTGDDAEIFDNYSYDPNMWCYFKIWIFSANTLTKTTDSVRMISSKF